MSKNKSIPTYSDQKKGNKKMTKEEFQRRLRNKLEILTEKAQEDEIRKYEEKIEEEKKQGRTEEEILSKLNIEEIAKNILENRGINLEKALKKNNIIYKKIEDLCYTINRIVDAMSKNTAKENTKIILNILIIVLVVCLLKIPFIFVKDLGLTIIEIFNNSILTKVWDIIFEILYVIVAVIVFVTIFTNWFKDLKGSNLKKFKKNPLEAISLKNEEN